MKNFGLVFDCDGTLLDSLGGAMNSFNYALGKIGESSRTDEEIKRYFGAGADRILSRLLNDERKGLMAFEMYLEHQAELAHGMKMHDGIRQLLETAAAAGVPMGVVTGRHARDMEAVLAPHKVSEYFQALIADSHVPVSKPAPDGILMAVSRMGLKPENICYVGDSVMDMQAAHAAGATAIAALWDPLAHAAAMRAEKPRFEASTPAEVWTHFLEFTQERV